jgi:co-chaperonin GroES (HSP10)
MKVLGNNLVVVQGEKQSERKGILLPDAAQEASNRAEVIAIGPGVQQIDVGDHVLIPLMTLARLAHTHICDLMVNDKPALVLKEDEVAVVWEKDDAS